MIKKILSTGAVLILAAFLAGYYAPAISPAFAAESSCSSGVKATFSNLPTYEYPQETDKNLYYPDTILSEDGERDSGKKSSGRDDRTVFKADGGENDSWVTGKWSMDAEDRWHFSVDGQECKSAWIYAFNPYASGTQERADWFYFDENGVMVTGWFTEPGTGTRYFMNPVSDGTMGRWIPNP